METPKKITKFYIPVLLLGFFSFLIHGIVIDSWKYASYNTFKGDKTAANGLFAGIIGFFIISYGFLKSKLDSNNILLTIAEQATYIVVYPLIILAIILGTVSLAKEYSRLMIITNFLIFLFILIYMLSYIIYRNNTFDLESKKKGLEFVKKIGFFVLPIASVLVGANIFFMNKQEIVKENFSDGTAKPIKDDKEPLQYINFSMQMNNIILGIMIFMLFLSTMGGTSKNVYLQNLHRIFFTPKKETNANDIKTSQSSSYIVFLYTFLATCYWLIICKEFDGKVSIEPSNINFPWIIALLGIPIFSYLIEMMYTLASGRNKKNGFQYNQLITIQFFRYFILYSFLLQPLISIALYSLYKPTTFKEINNASNINNNLLVFSDKGEYNLSNTGPVFSVHTATANYGNGVYVAGGRSNLDLETTRGIRYVSNDSHYYNLKYMDDDENHFVEIEREDDLNLFSLQTNDIAYGLGSKGGDAFWVAVGENVGLTEGNVSSIFYNNTAGTNDTTEYVPDISELNNWSPAVSGAFEYKGNGVVSASIGNVKWVAVGQDKEDLSATHGNIKYSADGKTWSSPTADDFFSGYGNKIAYKPVAGDARFVAVGYVTTGTNNILHSTNGTNWTSVAGFDGEGHDIAYGTHANNSVWVAVGSDPSNPVKISNDGSTWTNIHASNFDFTGPDQVLAVTYNLAKSRFYITGRASGSNNTSYIYESTDGGASWQKSADGKINGTLEVDSATAVASAYNSNILNLGNKTLTQAQDDYNNVYYPPPSYQNYFKKEVSSVSLTYFITFLYTMTTAVSIIFLYLVFKSKIDKKSETLNN